MSLRKYMVIDLLISGIIGMGVEFLGVYVFNNMLLAKIIPYAVSMLVVMITTSRWGNKGLIVIPFVALATVLSGRLINPHVDFAKAYDWKLYVSLVLSLYTFSLNHFWFKLRKNRKIKETPGSMMALCFIDIVTSWVVLTMVYFALTSELYILAFPVWGLYGYALLIIGTFLLFRQGVLINVKDNFLRLKEENQNDNDFRMCLDDLEIESDVEKGVFNDAESD